MKNRDRKRMRNILIRQSKKGIKGRERSEEAERNTENGKWVHEIRMRAQEKRRGNRKHRWLSGVVCVVLVFMFLIPSSHVAEAEEEVQILRICEDAIDLAVSITHHETLSPVSAKWEKRQMAYETMGERTIIYGEWESLGAIEVTAYCTCEKCVGTSGSDATYSGGKAQAGITAAADLNLFQIGNEIRIDGIDNIYKVEDRISPDRNEKLSLCFDNHEEALRFGRRRVPVHRRKVVDEIGPGEKLGTFSVTGYCDCEICCETSHTEEKLTKTGVKPRAGHTIAVDPEVIPLGSRLDIDGVTYTAEDTGSAVKGNRIDIYFDSHREAENYGRQEHTVFLLP